MAKIEDVAAYICDKYPYKSELSKARLTKLVYLSDWKSAQKRRKQLTDIRWYFHNFGPYVDDVINSVTNNPRFSVEDTLNAYGDKKTTISIKSPLASNILAPGEKRIVDDVIEETRGMYWDSFIRHVYATAPIARSERYSHLDLVKMAS